MTSLFSLYENELDEIVGDLSQYNFCSGSVRVCSSHRNTLAALMMKKEIMKPPKQPSVSSPEWAKQIYKKIAMQTHPDRVEQARAN